MTNLSLEELLARKNELRVEAMPINKFALSKDGGWGESKTVGYELLLRDPTGRSCGNLFRDRRISEASLVSLDATALEVFFNYLQGKSAERDIANLFYSMNLSRHLVKDRNLGLLDIFAQFREKLPGVRVIYEIDEDSDDKQLPLWKQLAKDSFSLELGLDDLQNPQAGHVASYFESLQEYIRLMKFDRMFFQSAMKLPSASQTVADSIKRTGQSQLTWVVEGVEGDEYRSFLATLMRQVQGEMASLDVYVQGYDVREILQPIGL